MMGSEYAGKCVGNHRLGFRMDPQSILGCLCRECGNAQVGMCPVLGEKCANVPKVHSCL